MAARVDPRHVRARHGPLAACIVDDTWPAQEGPSTRWAWRSSIVAYSANSTTARWSRESLWPMRAGEVFPFEWDPGGGSDEVLAVHAGPTTSRADMVRLTKLRWRIERHYQELQDEIGLDHFEGRGWRGFHYHAAFCIAAYAFLAAERLAHFPPEPLAFPPPRSSTYPKVSRRGAPPVRP